MRHETVFASAYSEATSETTEPLRTNIGEDEARHLDKAPVVGAFHDSRPIGLPAIYERSGPFEIRLAASARDLKQTRRLRFSVFYEEAGAIATPAAAAARLDLCPFDPICDHLVVLDTESVSRSGRVKPRIVGTYRLLRRDVAERHNGFYSESEFDLAAMLARHPKTRFLELGRSCVHPSYRSKRVIELLWRGLWLYATYHKVDALIGCASLPGTDLDVLRVPLSFLLGSAPADEIWQVAAWPHCAAQFEPVPPEQIDTRRALSTLPPLIKAYLRTGARFSTSAVIDRQFGTTDLFTVMPMGDIEERYLSHYGAPSCVSGVPNA